MLAREKHKRPAIQGGGGMGGSGIDGCHTNGTGKKIDEFLQITWNDDGGFFSDCRRGRGEH
jgi:hypothetical protein